MNESTPIVWINVTTTINWPNGIVGIVRVEKELDSKLGMLYPDAQFRRCIWRNNKFIEWHFPVEYTEIEDEPEPKPEPEPEPEMSMQRYFVVKVVSVFPKFMRPMVQDSMLYVRDKLRSLYRWARNIETIEEELVVTTLTKPLKPESIFKANDILISVGLEWEYSYTSEFAKLKKEQGIKIVSCCYDLIPVLFPQYSVIEGAATLFLNHFLELANSSDLVLCISEQSERDLKAELARTGGADVETLVFPLGDNVPTISTEEISDEIKAITAEPFILFVSTIERRKNHQVLYQAYHLLAKQGKKLPKLVFVGMQGWRVDDVLKDIALDPLTNGLIVQCNRVNDAELKSLYQAASFCVYPSLYEGWGLPVGEALSLGKVVLSSDRGSLPEVGGDLVTYIDPWNPQQWAEEIWRLLSDQAYLNEQAEKIQAHYKTRTWQQTAEVVKTMLDDLAQRPFETKVLYAGYDFDTEIGLQVGAAIRSNGQTGQLLCGPNYALPEGKYQIKISDLPQDRKAGEYLLSVKADQISVFEAEVVKFLPSATDTTALVEFEINLATEINDLDIEFELLSGELTIESVEIQPFNASLDDVNL